jgi:endonuclease G
MTSIQFEAVANDESLVNEIQQKLKSRDLLSNKIEMSEMFKPSISEGFEAMRLPTVDEAADAIREKGARDGNFEAIVLRFGRPSLFVKNGTFEVPESDVWKARLNPYKTFIDRAINSVGRVELINHSDYDWVGTAWMISDDIAITNRHVALTFAQKTDVGFGFRRDNYRAFVDFKEEHLQIGSYEVEVADVLYIGDDREDFPDLAFLKLKKMDSMVFPPPIQLYEGTPFNGQMVAAIGYPAYDSRNDAADMSRIFGNVYNVKRLAPGEVKAVGSAHEFEHDCTTLGGNSGSMVLDVATGRVLGLHFAGRYLQANFAVKSDVLKQFLDRLKITANPISVVVPSIISEPEIDSRVEAPQPKAEDLKRRIGYESGFLGDSDDLIVPLPTITDKIKNKAVIVTSDESGQSKYRLDYTHFTIAMNGERRLALFTATNIDGSTINRIKRKSDTWFYDPRIDKKFQVGNELYTKNDLDRGHLTRRLDPAWGDDFKQGELDTFFFTNCTPQHHLFNTKTWLGLEDYLLSSADTKDFKACVFTGPVFDDGIDRPFDFKTKDTMDRILLPLQYWKVAVMVKEDGTLSTTGYMISQKDLISNMEFIFGQYKTYQVPIRTIENLTSLSFNGLNIYDPLDSNESISYLELSNYEDIKI